MGVYAFVSRKAVPALGNVEGNTLFSALPETIDEGDLGGREMKKQKLPVVEEEDGIKVKKGGRVVTRLRSILTRAKKGISVKAGSSNSRTVSVYSTVSASNAIHSSCHAKAVAADMKHPKDPKGEWQGATMRNSR